jgi:4-amino-4-deoxy-L-arabinose transferase
MDPVAWLSFLGALAATIGAAAAAGRRDPRVPLLLLFLAALLLHGNLAWHEGLGRWDERFHALVARNLLDHPLVPILIERPLYDATASDWFNSHVWLHKPPLATWLMAGSMALFGENEFALRLPSVLLSASCVVLTFLIARRFLGVTAALLAAGFHAWFGRAALLSAGLRATDHVDAIFVFFVALGVLLALLAADRLGDRRRGAWWLTAATGVVTGLAYLTKSAPSVVVLAVFAVAVLPLRSTWLRRLSALAVASAVALAVAAPWTLYAALAFPDAYAESRSIVLDRVLHAVEGHAGPWYFHLANLPDHFGLLTWIPLLGFVYVASVRRRDWLPLVAWIGLTYLAFSLAATKMKSYVFIAAPVIFCALGWFAAAYLESWGRLSPRRRVLYGVTVLAVVLAYAGGGALKVHRPWRPLDRTPLWAEELRYLGEQVEHLPPGPWVVFGAPAEIEAMFYARATFSVLRPEPKHLAQARARGLQVAVYGRKDDLRLTRAGEFEGVRFIPPEPRTLAARRLLVRIYELGLGDALIVNAPYGDEIAAYLNRIGYLEVLGAVSPANPAVARAVERGRRIVVVERVGESIPPELARLPGAVLLSEPRAGD